VSRRVSVPRADELLRSTDESGASTPDAPLADPAGRERLRAVPDGWTEPSATGRRRSSGRTRHDEKITVYVSAGELVDLERARLTLRAGHGLAVDRGRIVREAIAAILEDLDARGEESTLVQRLLQA
jgi:hypothetical protein